MNHRLVSVQDRRRGAINGAQRLALVGGQPSEPPRRKPRAMAISPAPIQSCCTAGITSLLVPKRSFLAGLIKSPNRWRWLAHRGFIL